MSIATKIFTFNPSNRLVNNVRILLLTWLLTLPFGSNLFQFSLGFLTIYPNLILTLALFPFALVTIKKWRGFELLLVIFLFIWTITEIFIVGKSEVSKEAVFDIRSLLMQFLYATTLIGVFKFVGKEGFYKILITGLRCFLFILLLTGIIEFLTGIHFAGNKTADLLNLPVGNIFYAPMFIYDNPNDYLTYLIFIFLLSNLFDEKLRANYLLKLFSFT